MKSYAIFNSDGEILARASGAHSPTEPGRQALEIQDSELNLNGCYVADGVLTAYTPEQIAARSSKPRPRTKWSNASMQWQDARTLSQAKTERIQAMSAERDAAIAGGFMWNGSTFKSNAEAEIRLLDLKVAASQLGFISRNWRLADNTWRSLNAIEAAAVWAALDAHIQAQFLNFAARETTINNASTIAAVDAVTWE